MDGGSEPLDSPEGIGPVIWFDSSLKPEVSLVIWPSSVGSEEERVLLNNLKSVFNCDILPYWEGIDPVSRLFLRENVPAISVMPSSVGSEDERELP